MAIHVYRRMAFACRVALTYLTRQSLTRNCACLATTAASLKKVPSAPAFRPSQAPGAATCATTFS